ncbi:MAG: hypothetical protein LT103_12005 [Burkholderiaceae bacterium]|nr:hypothetical protein [Burkholderiaceae bacterium]
MKSFVRFGIVLAAAGLFAGAAQAHGSVSWSLNIGTPGFGLYAPAPVYAAPVVVAPPAYYYAPPPVYYYGPPYAVAPAPVWVGPRHRPYRHWQRDEWRRRYR